MAQSQEITTTDVLDTAVYLGLILAAVLLALAALKRLLGGK